MARLARSKQRLAGGQAAAPWAERLKRKAAQVRHSFTGLTFLHPVQACCEDWGPAAACTTLLLLWWGCL